MYQSIERKSNPVTPKMPKKTDAAQRSAAAEKKSAFFPRAESEPRENQTDRLYQKLESRMDGLPRGLAEGITALSGFDVSGVKVHYHSDKPKRFDALAFSQGSDIFVAPGQDRSLPHEAWHYVQKLQGRVKPAGTFNGTQINEDAALEREADVMGARAAHSAAVQKIGAAPSPSRSGLLNVAQFHKIILNKKTTGSLIGVNLMPSFQWRDLIPFWGRGYAALSDKIAGHTSLVWLKKDEQNPTLESGSGFSPKGFLNSARVGAMGFLSRLPCVGGLFGQSRVPGDFHSEPQAIIDDPRADQLLIGVEKKTAKRWKILIGKKGEKRPLIYSYNPGRGMNRNFEASEEAGADNSDNCTTFALRNARDVCSQMIERAQSYKIQRDVPALKQLLKAINGITAFIVQKNQQKRTAVGTQGRAMAAFKEVREQAVERRQIRAGRHRNRRRRRSRRNRRKNLTRR